MTREEAIDIFEHNWTRLVNPDYTEEELNKAFGIALKALEQEPKWIPVSERLPIINQRVLLISSGGLAFVGNRCEPELIWQVTEEDGRKHWVYDPEDYTDDIDSLPKGEDCSFEQNSRYGDTMFSVSSENYDPQFDGVIAWMPLPEPYKAGGEGKNE